MVTAIDTGHGTQFIVEFKGIKLPDEFQRSMEQAIQRAALAELSRLDTNPRKDLDFIIRFPHGTMGIIAWPREIPVEQ